MTCALIPGVDRKAPRPVRYAVVLKAYFWDDFVERQARRCEASTGPGDFYILLDESNGTLPAIPFRRVVRTSNAALIARGFANRFEEGSLFWWNADYPHYFFFEAHPDYDFYVFLEYDALYSGDFASLIRACDEAAADLVVHELQVSKEIWAWTRPHLPVYPFQELEGCLMSVSIHSARALAVLAARRLAMSQDDLVTYWPLAEVFLPTEVRRAGLRCLPLANFGATEAFRWRPALVEAEALLSGTDAFFHPVYDEGRFVNWALAQGTTLRDFLDPQGPVLPHLARIARRVYLPSLAKAVGQSALSSLKARSVAILAQGSAFLQSCLMLRQP